MFPLLYISTVIPSINASDVYFRYDGAFYYVKGIYIYTPMKRPIHLQRNGREDGKKTLDFNISCARIANTVPRNTIRWIRHECIIKPFPRCLARTAGVP